MLSSAISIVQKLQENGFEAFFAGGWVRDFVLGSKEESNDIDIATSALPEEIELIFPKTFALGANFGVMVVRENSMNFEVTTFRKDSGGGDGRRPDFVQYSDKHQDALRRDFTINGMFYDPITKEIFDFVEGKRDLKRGLLRFIGDPEKRIREDYLRILRAIRFKNRFRLSYEKETQKALKNHCTAVFNVSAERVLQEFTKILSHSSRAKALQDLDDLEMLEHVFPEMVEMKNTQQPKDHHSEGDVFTHTLLALQNIPEGENIELYWAVLFHDIGKAFTAKFDGERWRYNDHETVSSEKSRKIMNRLSFSKKSREKICWMIEHEQIFDQFFEMKLATRLEYYDHPHFDDLLLLQMYDVKGCKPLGEENKKTKDKRLRMLNRIAENKNYAKSNKLLPSYKNELVSGKEIMDILKISTGEKIGIIKKQLREAQLHGEIHSHKEAIAFLKTL